MGGAGDSVTKAKQVATTLLKWANILLDFPVPVSDDPDANAEKLREALDRIAISHFRRFFGYDFNYSDTNPPKANGNIQVPLTDFTNLALSKIQNINLYVDNVVFPSDGDIPDWALQKMRGDLETWVKDILAQSSIEAWQTADYKRTYRDPHKNNAIRIDAQTIYTVVQAEVGNSAQATLFLNFVGMGYTVDAASIKGWD